MHRGLLSLASIREKKEKIGEKHNAYFAELLQIEQNVATNRNCIFTAE
jgi:hypothetical protein